MPFVLGILKSNGVKLREDSEGSKGEFGFFREPVQKWNLETGVEHDENHNGANGRQAQETHEKPNEPAGEAVDGVDGLETSHVFFGRKEKNSWDD